METKPTKHTGRIPKDRPPKTRLQAIREAKGITQRRLSILTDICQASMSRAEWEGTGIGLKGWLEISRVLDVDLREIFPAEEEPTVA